MFKLFKKIFSKQVEELSEFDINNPLGVGGERVDFIYDKNFDFSKLDMYQKNHYRRYEFALKTIHNEEICGDFACGAGYGSAMLATKALKVIGIDLNLKVIESIKKRYADLSNIEFLAKNLLELDYEETFSTIVSFETIEHFNENEITNLYSIFNNALITNGILIFSTPFMQDKSEAAIKMGFHKTFYIDEKRIEDWLHGTGFNVLQYYYQNYEKHTIHDTLDKKDFIICIAQKK